MILITRQILMPQASASYEGILYIKIDLFEEKEQRF